MHRSHTASLHTVAWAALVGIAVALWAPGARAAPTPVITAPFVTAAVGDTIKVSISFAHVVDLAFFQFDLAFDPLIVQADASGAQGGAGLPADWFFTSPGAVDNLAGLILGIAANGSAFSDAVEAVDLYFTAIKAGESPLTFSSVFLNLLDSGFDTSNGRITVSGPNTVSEPPALALLALAGVLWRRRHRRPNRSHASPHVDAQTGSRTHEQCQPQAPSSQGEPTVNMHPSFKRALVSLVALTALALGASPGHAQVVANGPYYATPSWDQTMPGATRYIVLSNMASEAVLDRETGLVWQRNPSAAPGVYFSAMDGCFRAKTGHRSGWRLPRISELQSLMEEGADGRVSLPVGHPFGPVGDGFYWTSSESLSDTANLGFMVVGSNAVAIFQANKFSAIAGRWCVRGGVLTDRAY